ncbi:MAG: aminoglycoside phosphotransferase family protein [Truepera sp.]|nr:aminoglycoside phosphotransferase family protein [Truepera sp.]
MPESLTAVPLYPQAEFPEDHNLPGLPQLFDGEWVWEAYCSRVGDREISPRQLRIRQFSHLPGRYVVVTYVLEWQRDEYIPSEQFTLRLERGKPVELFRYPEDRHLPGLKRAAHPETAARLINSYVLAIPTRYPVRVYLIRYRPGNRAVLRHRIGKVGFYVRAVRPVTVPPLLKAAELIGHSRFVVPRLAGHWQDGGVLWLSEIPGKNLREYIRKGGQPEPTLLLEGLESLWAAPYRTGNGRPFDLPGAYRRAKRVFKHALQGDDTEGARRKLSHATQALNPFVESWRPRCIAHNDFYDDQMLLLPDGRVALVDFEEVGPGDPMLDVGNLLAHLRWASRFGRGSEAAATAAYHNLFQQAALERLGWSKRELVLREAVSLFRIGTNPLRRLRKDWYRDLEAGLALVNEILASTVETSEVPTAPS